MPFLTAKCQIRSRSARARIARDARTTREGDSSTLPSRPGFGSCRLPEVVSLARDKDMLDDDGPNLRIAHRKRKVAGRCFYKVRLKAGTLDDLM